GFYCLKGSTAAAPDDTELWAGECPLGTFCPNATALPTPCEAGHYCASLNLENALPCAGGFYCIQGSSTPTPTGEMNANGLIGNECPAGTYCPIGTSNPIPCPSGTFSGVKQLQNVAQCLPCPAGYSCPDTGTVVPSAPCPPTVFCPGNNTQTTCPVGHYCPGGVLTAPLPCRAGTFANITGLPACFGCPTRFYCEIGAVNPVPCNSGYYCPSNTSVATQFPCPPGTFSSVASLASASECAPCPAGQYCSGLPPTVVPTGACAPGYYCSLGAKTPMPNDGTGGVCDDGHVCLGGAGIKDPVDGITGRLCQAGSFCVKGTEQACPMHTYTAVAGRSSCDPCPLGRYCAGNTSNPSPCPQRFYCPGGQPILCPNGTYGAQMGLEQAAQCSPCPAGQFCTDGTITGPCASGYFCKFGNYQPNPLNYNQSLLPWQQQSGGACPIGYYCTQNTTDPLPCPGNSSRLSPFGTQLYDCAACPAGKSCLDGAMTAGYYCPLAQLPIPCPKGTYNPFVGGATVENCLACTAGRYCNRTGSVNDTAFACPAGSFCVTGATDAAPCPAGSYRPTTGGAAVTDCTECPAGYACPAGSLYPVVCQAGFYCPAGAGNMTICAPGYYCPFNSTAGVPCQAGYYCPTGAVNQTACGFGTYCPALASSPIPCPAGSLSLLRPSNTLYSSLAEACQRCPKGTYGNGANCSTCSEGYVCLEGCTSPAPQNVTADHGYPCPAGYYCGNGTYQERPCPVGTFNPSTMGTSLNESCTPCPINTYQYETGQATCFPCSTSSNAALGSAQCQCVGQNRAFQKSDGYCICEAGYEYYDANGILRSDTDDTADCQPIVYARCSGNQVRSVSGGCVNPSSVSCASACDGGSGTFLATSGLCTCTNVPTLDAVCDSACRATSTQLRLNPATGALQYYDPTTETYTPVPAADTAAIAGSFSCSTNSSSANCQVHTMTVSGDAFSGTYSAALPSTAGRRRLSAAGSGILNPMLCLQRSDSVLFSLSAGSYPVYVKDSLMNTNPSFDYGTFRTLQETMQSNATAVNAFAFTFLDAGMYVFALSNNSAALTIVAVMDIGVKCPTDGPIVPMTQGNLIVLSAKPSSNIILAPDWGLIAGLLCALFGVVAGMICGLYYFRRKSWVAKHSSTGGYKEKARGFNLDKLHTKGSVVKKNAKALPDAEAHDGAVLPDDSAAKAMPEAGGDYVPELNRWDDDDLGIRELVDRLQFHHDSVEKAFQDQETGAAKMMKMLQNEADELKMLLASIVVAQKNHEKDKEPAGCDAELVLLDTLQKGVADRAEFVATLSAAETGVAAAAKALHGHAQTKGNVAATILDELTSAAGVSASYDQLVADLEAFRRSVLVEPGALSTVQSEINRRKVQGAVWKAFGNTTKELLPPALLTSKAACEEAYASRDAATAQATEYLVKFASVVPGYAKKLADFREAFAAEWAAAVEQQNPAVLKPVRQKYEKLLTGLLKELQSGTTKLVARVSADQQALATARGRGTADEAQYAAELASLRDHLAVTMAPAAEVAPASDVQELVMQLRALLAAPGQLQLAPLNLDKLIDAAAEGNATSAPTVATDDEALLTAELRNEEARDAAHISKLRQEFTAGVDAQDLSAAERAQLLDAFNEDMANLEATLRLEREKHQEQLRNRLAIRKLKKDTELEALLQDEALEEAMLTKQEAEMQALERAFEEEQAKLEAEFGGFGGEGDESFSPAVDDFGGDGDETLPPSTNDDTDTNSEPKRTQRQAAIEDERRRAKKRIAARSKVQEAAATSPGEGALVRFMAQLEDNRVDRAFDACQDKLSIELLASKALDDPPSTRDAKALAQATSDLERRRATRSKAVARDEAAWQAKLLALEATGATLSPELQAADARLRQALQLEMDAFTPEKLLTTVQSGTLSDADAALVDRLHDDFASKWKERNERLQSEHARSSQSLHARLQARKAKTDPQAITPEDVQDTELLRALVSERNALEAIATAHKANDAGQAIDAAAVAKLQETFAKDWARQQALLDTEATVKRQQLEARLKRQRKATEELPAAERPPVLAALASEEMTASRKMEQEIQVAKEALQTSILVDKATLETLSEEDKAAIQRLLDDHASKWADRARQLHDEHKDARANLAKRLHSRASAKSLHALATKALEDDFEAKEEALALAALVEKAQVGSLSPQEVMTVASIEATYEAKWSGRRKELDMAEATATYELEAANEATPDTLVDVAQAMDLQRETLEIHALQEARQLQALRAAAGSVDDDQIERVIADYAAAHRRRLQELDDKAAARQAKLAERVRRQRHANEALPVDERDAANRALDADALSAAHENELETTVLKEVATTSLLIEKAKERKLTPEDNMAVAELLASHEKKWAERRKMLANDQALAKATLADRLKKRHNKALNSAEVMAVDLHAAIVNEAFATAALVEKAALGMPLTATDSAALEKLLTTHGAKWAQRRALLNAAEAEAESALGQEATATPEHREELAMAMAKERDLIEHQEAVEAQQIAAIAAAHHTVLAAAPADEDQNAATIAKLNDAFARNRQRERARLEAEAQLRRDKLAERLKRQRKAMDQLPATERETATDALEAQAALESRTIEMNAAVEKEAAVVAALAEKKTLGTLTADDDAVIAALLRDHEAKWRDRNRQLNDDRDFARAQLAARLAKRNGKPLAAAVAKGVDDMYARQEEAIAVASLVEKAQLGALTPTDEEAIRVLSDTHEVKWQERLNELDRLEDGWSEALLGDATAPTDAVACLREYVDAQRLAVIQQAVLEKQQLQTLRPDAPPITADDDAIAALQAAYTREWARRQQALADEAAMRRDRLAARLQRQRRNNDGLAVAERDAANAIADAENEQAVRALELEAAVRREALDTELLIAKAQLGQLPQDNSTLIDKLLNDHKAKWAARQRQLQDDRALAKSNLAARLAKRSDKTLANLATATLEHACGALDTTVALAALLEKAQLGRCTDVDIAAFETAKQIHTKNFTAQQAALDAIEAQALAIPDDAGMGDILRSVIQAERDVVVGYEANQARQLAAIAEALQTPKGLCDYSDVINKVLDDHDVARKARMQRLADEEKRLKARLQERLAKRQARVASTPDETAVLEAQLARQVELQRDAIELQHLAEKQAAGELTNDDEATIERLRREHAAKSQALREALNDEERRLKASLQDRLRAKRDAIGAQQWPSVQAKAQALNQLLEDEKAETLDIEHAIDVKEQATAAALLEQRAQLDTLAAGDGDADTIAKLRADHDARWQERQRDLEDEAKRLRGRLGDRLQKRRALHDRSTASLVEKQQVEKDMAADEALLREALEQQLQERSRQLEAARLAEKARRGLLSATDEALVRQASDSTSSLSDGHIQDEHAAKTRLRQQELDAEEARKKELLRARLAAKRALNAKSAKPPAEKEAIAMQLDAQESKAVQQIEESMDTKRRLEAREAAVVAAALPPPNFDATINDLHAEHAKRKAERDAALGDEEARQRLRLIDRLAMRKRHDSLTDAEAAELQAQLEAALCQRRQEAEMAELLDKAQRKIATTDDEELIRKLQAELGRSSKERDDALRDEEALLKDRLQQRLANKRAKASALESTQKDALLRQLDEEEDREAAAIEAAIDAKRLAVDVVVWAPPAFPRPSIADHESDIQAINAELERHSLERQRLLDEEEKLKKARLQERMDKKRAARSHAAEAANQAALDQAQLDADMAQIEADMAAKRLAAEEQAKVEQASVAAAAADAIASAKAASQRQVDGMIAQVKSDHEREMAALQESLRADRAKQELALQERIAARRANRRSDKTNGEPTSARDDAEVAALKEKLDADEAAALAAAKEKVDEEIAALRRQAAASAELNAHRAAEEKNLAEAEWNRLRSEHVADMTALQATLEAEQARQEAKLKDRIKARRLAKEKDLAASATPETLASATAALDEEERIEKECLAAQLAQQAEAALQEELRRQQEAERMAAQKIANAAIEAAAAAAAMEAFQAAELDRVSADFKAQMARRAASDAAEATTQKSKLEMRMAAKKQKKALELQAKKEQETRRLTEAQAAEVQEVQSRLEGAAVLAQAAALEVQAAPAAEALATDQEAARAALAAQQATEAARLEAEAKLELEAAQRALQAKMQHDLDVTRAKLQSEMAASQSQLQESHSQILVKAELDRVQKEFHEKERALTDSLKLESSQRKKDLMRRLEEKKRKKTDDLLAKQQQEREAQKDQHEALAAKLEMDREVAMIQKLLSQNQIVLSQLRAVIIRVVEKRHKREQTLLFAKQYRARTALLRSALEALVAEKAAAKTALLAQLEGADTAAKEAQLEELDASFRVKQQEIEAHGTGDMEAAQTHEQEALRVRQGNDITQLYERFAASCLPDPVPVPTAVAVAPTTVTVAATGIVVADENAALRAHLELEKQKRIETILKESAAAMQALREALAREWAAVDAACSGQLATEQATSEAAWAARRQRLAATTSGPRAAAMLQALEADAHKQHTALATMLQARAQRKKERHERVCKRKLKRIDDDTKRRIDIVHAEALVALTDEIERAKQAAAPPRATSTSDPADLALVGFGRDRLQNAIGKARSLSRLGSIGARTPRETQERRVAAQMAVPPDHSIETTALTPGHSASVPSLATVSDVHHEGDAHSGPASEAVAAIAQKLDSIERLIQLISTQKAPSPPASLSDLKSAIRSAYPGLEQDARVPPGPLAPIVDAALPPRQKMRLDFGRALALTLEPALADVRIEAAATLPAHIAGGAFEHSIFYDARARTLYVRQARLESAAEFAVLLVHTFAHLHADAAAFDDDTAPVFVATFYRMLGRCYQEHFSKTEAVPPVASVGVSPPLDVVPKATQYFQSDLITQRLANMQAFLERMEDAGDSNELRSPLLVKKTSAPMLKTLTSVGSTRGFFMANSEQQVQSLQVHASGEVSGVKVGEQECLDIAEKSYMETLKRYTETSDSVELLEDALNEARAEGHAEDEVHTLQHQLAEAKHDLERVKKDRDEVAQRCEKLRNEIKVKLGKA
ncbi:hypothetical protein ACHHYP_01968, partial [Achlya hypogyna]